MSEIPQPWWNEPPATPTGHEYTSTACWHATRNGNPDLHEYCKADTGLSGSKRAAECKWCRSPCRCDCHA